LLRASNEARKLGEAYLAQVLPHLKSLGLLEEGEGYREAPRKIITVYASKL
jgi:hypothetical protein